MLCNPGTKDPGEPGSGSYLAFICPRSVLHSIPSCLELLNTCLSPHRRAQSSAFPKVCVPTGHPCVTDRCPARSPDLGLQFPGPSRPCFLTSPTLGKSRLTHRLFPSPLLPFQTSNTCLVLTYLGLSWLHRCPNPNSGLFSDSTEVAKIQRNIQE